MADIKLRDNTGAERTYTGIDTITLPLADGSGQHKFGFGDEDFIMDTQYWEGNETLLYELRPFNDIITANLHRLSFVPHVTDYGKQVNVPEIIKSTQSFDLSVLVLDKNDPDYISFKNPVSIFATNTVPPTLQHNNLGIYIDTSQPLFGYTCRSVDDYIDFLSHFDHIAFNSYIYPFVLSMVYANDSDDNEAVADITNDIYNSENSIYIYPLTQCLYEIPYCHCGLRKIKIPVINDVNGEVSFRFEYGDHGRFLDSFSFCKNGDEPYSVTWGYSLWLLASNFDCYIGYSIHEYDWYESDRGLWSNPVNIFTSDSMTIEEAQERYDEVKDEPYWVSQSTGYADYDGKSLPIARLFSRFNHDSAVEFIDSLPDVTSTPGDQHEIHLDNYLGALTDAGGTNDLTPAEIAVATAKGWTIVLEN